MAPAAELAVEWNPPHRHGGRLSRLAVAAIAVSVVLAIFVVVFVMAVVLPLGHHVSPVGGGG